MGKLWDNEMSVLTDQFVSRLSGKSPTVCECSLLQASSTLACGRERMEKPASFKRSDLKLQTGLFGEVCPESQISNPIFRLRTESGLESHVSKDIKYIFQSTHRAAALPRKRKIRASPSHSAHAPPLCSPPPSL